MLREGCQLIGHWLIWIYPDIQKKDMRPLPYCTYAMGRAVYPSTGDEEIWADLQHTVFIADPDS